ncbi:inositol monophosphatase family protein, partial [Rhizobium rhizogenes]|uniref:inositol monophosphatase family protein n=1 Tax=Rhizobium rhizogenes TaxID=359 RepID=UPI0028692AEB
MSRRSPRKAGERALDHFRSLSSLPVETKGHLDLVTEADKDVEAFLIGSLREAFPDDGIMGEESGEIPGASGRVWVIDPIDGMSVPEQYSPIVPFESSPGAAAAGLPGRAPEDRR